MTRTVITTEAAPAAIGSYSQAVRAGDTVYCSGQIALDPTTGELAAADISAEIRQVFRNLAAVAEAAGGSLGHAAKLTVYLTDLGHFALLNEIMAEFFEAPFPARAAVGVAALPRNARVEVDAVLVL